MIGWQSVPLSECNVTGLTPISSRRTDDAERIHTVDETERSDLTASDAIERIRTLVDSAETCFFCTNVGSDGGNQAESIMSSGTRPMSVRKVDAEENLWFLSAVDSHKNAELQRDPLVCLLFQGSPHAEFLHLRGTASITTDRSTIAELWSPFIKTWFTEGVDDPRITAICVKPSEGYYWDNKHGSAVAGVKLLIGAVIGKTMDDSVEGRLSV